MATWAAVPMATWAVVHGYLGCSAMATGTLCITVSYARTDR